MANANQAGSKSSKAGASRKAQPRKKQTTFNRDFVSFLLLCLTIIFSLILLLKADEYSPLSSIKSVFSGLLGSMGWTLPVLCAAASYFAYRSGGEKPYLYKTWFTAFSLWLLLLTIVEAFHCEAITSGMDIPGGYVNFLTHAYGANAGGGFFGALLAKPFYSLMDVWGAVLISIFLIILVLFAVGAFSIDDVRSRIRSVLPERREAEPKAAKPASAEKKARAAAKPAPAPRAKHPKDDVFEVKSSAQRAARPIGKIYNEPILDDAPINRDAPVRLPNLNAAGAHIKKHSVTDDGEFEVPVVHPEKSDPYADLYDAPPKKKKGRASAPKAEAPRKREPSIEKIDLMDAVRNESDEERNRKYREAALRDHSKKPKPVLGYSTPFNSAEAKAPQADNAYLESIEASPEYEDAQAPAFKAPARKAAPAETVKAVREASEPAPVKKTPQAPKPSFFEDEPASKAAEKPYPDRTAAIRRDSEPAPAEKNPPVQKPAQEEYDFPPIDLMETGGRVETSDGYDATDMQRADMLVKTLQSFSVPVKITGISHGPAVTRFELLPAPGIRVSKIASYADDIAMNLAAESVRVEAPIPGKSAVGVELPNLKKEIVHLRDVLESPEARKAASRLAVALGKDNSGKYIVADLASMPHVLIAGQTGSGKSVCINSIIISILYRSTPEEVRMIMIDPKMVELNAYNTIPHLLVPVVTDPKKAASALDWAVSEMTRRYKEFAARGAKNIQSYNKKLAEGEKPMPQIVLIVDELADLMMTAPHDVEEAINRLAQLARAAGIHLVIATQRPSVNVITGVIKANIPTRIAFTVASGVDSRTILDSYGAETLLGKGDMLYLPQDRNKPLRIQGAWVSESEVQAVVDYISNTNNTNFDEDILEHMENAVLSDAEKSDKRAEETEDQVDDLFPVAVKAVMEAGQASISMLQRKLRVGYARAGRLIDEMASRGFVSESEGSKSREVRITPAQYYELFGDDDADFQ